MKRLAALLLLAPALAWANFAVDAEQAAERVLIEENVLTVYFTANDEGRLTLLFGRQVGAEQRRPHRRMDFVYQDKLQAVA